MADPDGNEFCVMNHVLPPRTEAVPPPLTCRAQPARYCLNVTHHTYNDAANCRSVAFEPVSTSRRFARTVAEGRTSANQLRTSPATWSCDRPISTLPIGRSARRTHATIPVGDAPVGVAINPAGTFAYITNHDSGTVSKISLAFDTVVATIPVGKYPTIAAINPAGTFAYVTNSGSDTVSKINLAFDTVVATIPVGDAPTDVAINPAGTFAYITNASSGTVSKISLTVSNTG